MLVRKIHRLLPAAFAMVICSHAIAQVAYPDVYINDVDWTSGTRFFTVPQRIISPGDANLPASTTEAAHTEFISGTEIRLTPGFHGGDLTGDGRFRAWIDQGLGVPEDVIAISPDPTTHVVENVMHVEKWEKLELALKLPQEYRDAIDQFFGNYYSNGVTNASTPGNIDDVHDLNPFADDSLQLVMHLTSPSGAQRIKWGFYMTEAMWTVEPPTPDALLVDDTSDPLLSHNIHFRFAPDEEGTWQFALSIKAPHTVNMANEALAEVHYNGYTFICDPPLADNKGYLSVNPNNRRSLWFKTTEEPFMGLGTNIAHPLVSTPGELKFKNFDLMRRSIEDLHSGGGNYARIFMMGGAFATEWQNLGVYDHYRAPQCYDNAVHIGNCQNQNWALDRVIDQAHTNGIYVQLCIDPYPPIKVYENTNWHSHAYVDAFLEPSRIPQGSGTYDMKQFFYSIDQSDPQNPVRLYDSGVFYYWKRKYKYIMSRWGYSVNLAVIEPFNEIDQILTYAPTNISDPNFPEYNTTCPENRLNWLEDPYLQTTIKDWLTDIAHYVRGPVTDPVSSSLGDTTKLFLLSYALADPSQLAHYIPFTSPGVDLIDAHKGYGSDVIADQGQPDGKMNDAYDSAHDFWNSFPELNSPLGERKPFNHGEFSHNTRVNLGTFHDDLEKIFLNYDVSFHNEIWASAFSGKFAAGTSWNWYRIFWWQDALPRPPANPFSPVFQQHHPQGYYSNVLGGTDLDPNGASNYIDVGGLAIAIPNRKLTHHFKPLADLLMLPGVQNFQFFTWDYTPHKLYSASDQIECYYLQSSDDVMAIGWVHNLNAWVMNSFYLSTGLNNENFLGCDPPNLLPQTIEITGLLEDHNYYIHWFPTRMNSTICPADAEDLDQNGSVTLDLSSAMLGGTYNNYLDTLHSDYAFIISPFPEVKSLTLPTVEQVRPSDWDFTLFPNPTRDELFVRLPDDKPKSIVIYDLAGRQINVWSSVIGPVQHLPITEIAKGAYWVRVSDGSNSKTKQLIIH
ncbi:MAG: T9SS type A sorting domain-containing protein [Flavobacteriales bacterium]